MPDSFSRPANTQNCEHLLKGKGKQFAHFPRLSLLPTALDLSARDNRINRLARINISHPIPPFHCDEL